MANTTDIQQSIKDILAQMATIKDDAGNTAFVFTAVWNDHLKRLVDGKGYSFQTPALFVELNWKQTTVLNGGLMAEDLDVIFHIVHNQLDAADGTLDQNLSVIDYRRYVIAAFTGFYPTAMSGLMFSKGAGDYKHTDTYHRVVTFKTIYLDQDGTGLATGAEYYRNPPVTLVINGVLIDPMLPPRGVGYDEVGLTDEIN